MTMGIYKITCLVDDKFYIGSTNNFSSRWNYHKNCLRRNCHDNNYLQNSWNKHGEDNFKFEIIKYVNSRDKLIEEEQKELNNFIPFDRNILFNICEAASTLKGIKRSDKFKQNLSLKRTGENNPMYGVVGNAAPASKLTEQNVLEIISLSSQNISQNELGRKFDVTQGTIWKILNGYSWSWLTKR